LQGEDRDAARSLDEDGLPRNDAGVFRESVPCRHRSAWQCCAFLERQVGGQLNDAVLFEDCVFSEHSIDAAAQRAGMRVSGRGAADPTLKKASRYAITDFDAAYTGADLDDESPVR